MEKILTKRSRGEERVIYNELMKYGLELSKIRVKFDPCIFPWEPSEEDLSQNWYITGLFISLPIKDENGNLIKGEKYSASLTREDGKKLFNGACFVNQKTRVQEIFPCIPVEDDKEGLLLKLNLAYKA